MPHKQFDVVGPCQPVTEWYINQFGSWCRLSLLLQPLQKAKCSFGERMWACQSRQSSSWHDTFVFCSVSFSWILTAMNLGYSKVILYSSKLAQPWWKTPLTMAVLALLTLLCRAWHTLHLGRKAMFQLNQKALEKKLLLLRHTNPQNDL